MELRPSGSRPPADENSVEPAMSQQSALTALNLEDSALLRLLAAALERVQRRRHLPKKKGQLHRV